MRKMHADLTFQPLSGIDIGSLITTTCTTIFKDPAFAQIFLKFGTEKVEGSGITKYAKTGDQTKKPPRAVAGGV